MHGSSFVLYHRSTATRFGYRDVSASDLFRSRGSTRVIDVRDPHEYAAGHIPGVELVPFANLATCVSIWDKQAEVLLVSRSGALSGHAAEALEAAGFHRVMNLAGGMRAYVAAGLPVERLPPPARLAPAPTPAPILRAASR
jgi:rhodanese-related sulfurtransferase